MRKTTHGWTVYTHSDTYYVDPGDIPCRGSETDPISKTDMREDIGERRRRRRRGECGIRMEKRERERRRDRKTTHGWTLVHSLQNVISRHPMPRGLR